MFFVYYFLKYTWTEAQEYCRLEGGELAKVTNTNLYNNLRLSVSQKSSKKTEFYLIYFLNE